jgi:hypothetical protein
MIPVLTTGSVWPGLKIERVRSSRMPGITQSYSWRSFETVYSIGTLRMADELAGQVVGLRSERLHAAAEPIAERLHLLVGRVVVEVHVHPVLRLVLTEAAPDRDVGDAVHLHVAEVAVIDVDGVGVVAAVAVRGLLVEPAGTGRRTAAGDDARADEIDVRRAGR